MLKVQCVYADTALQEDVSFAGEMKTFDGPGVIGLLRDALIKDVGEENVDPEENYEVVSWTAVGRTKYAAAFVVKTFDAYFGEILIAGIVYKSK